MVSTYLSKLVGVKGKCFVPKPILVGNNEESLNPVVMGKTPTAAAADDDVDDDDGGSRPNDVAVAGRPDDDDADAEAAGGTGGTGAMSSAKNVNFLVCSSCICVTNIL